MLRYTASSAAFCSSSSLASDRITDSTEPGPSSASPRAAAAPCSSRPASASSVSAETLSASASSRNTRTDGWCRPRSIWLRYGLDRLVRSASWRSDRFASLRWLRMKLPSAFIWASHASVTVTSPPWAYADVLTILSNAPRGGPCQGRRATVGSCARCNGRWNGPAGLSRRPALLGGVAGLLGSGSGVAVEQRRGRVQHVLGELALRGKKLLNEVVGAGHQLARLGQLVGERHTHLGKRRLDGLDGVRPHLDRVDHGLLALADGLQNLTLELLPHGLGVAHGSSLTSLQTKVRKFAALVKRPLDISSGRALNRGYSSPARQRSPGISCCPEKAPRYGAPPACPPTWPSPPTRTRCGAPPPPATAAR